MARTGITKEQVEEAIAGIIDGGGLPTVSVIRERIGSGSFSTISTYLKEWKEREEGAEAAVPTMPDSVSGAAVRIWREAYQAAHLLLEGERAALTQANAQLELERYEMGQEIKRLEAAHEEVQGQLGSLQKERQEQDVQKARIEERLRSAEKALSYKAADCLVLEKQLAEERSKRGQLEAQLVELAKGRQSKPAPAKKKAVRSRVKTPVQKGGNKE